MLRVDLHHARPGMNLALPVQNPRSPGRTLLKVGYALTDEIIQKLKEHEIRQVWVRYPSLDFLDKFVSRDLIEGQQQLLGHIANTFETVQGKSSAKLEYEAYVSTIERLIEHLLTSPQAAVFLGDIDHASDDLMRHSSAVAYLSLLLGLKLEGYMVRERKHVDPARAKEVRSLGLGAMLHDVGILSLPEEVRARYLATGNEADPEWQEHPAEGWRLVRGKIDPSAASVILHHHQRYDGAGYAGQNMPILEGHRIHVFARVVAVADEFDRLRHPVGGEPRPTVWALGAMLAESMRGRFDPHVLGMLLSVAPPYAPGSTVRLSDGRYAVVIDHNAEQPCRPTLQTIPAPQQLGDEDLPPGDPIDLRQEDAKLFVAEAEGFDVSELNFRPPGDLTARVGKAA